MMSPRDTFARIAKALADPQRCEILECIAAAGELSCAALHEKFRISQATISHHLKELATAGLLERRKEGQFGYYRFLPDTLRAYVDELGARCCVRQHMAAAEAAAKKAKAAESTAAEIEAEADPTAEAKTSAERGLHRPPPMDTSANHGSPSPSHAAHPSPPYAHAPPAHASGHAHTAPGHPAVPHTGLSSAAMAIEMRRGESSPPGASPSGFSKVGAHKSNDR